MKIGKSATKSEEEAEELVNLAVKLIKDAEEAKIVAALMVKMFTVMHDEGVKEVVKSDPQPPPLKEPPLKEPEGPPPKEPPPKGEPQKEGPEGQPQAPQQKHQHAELKVNNALTQQIVVKKEEKN
jgi:hypothetical protein